MFGGIFREVTPGPMARGFCMVRVYGVERGNANIRGFC